MKNPEEPFPSLAEIEAEVLAEGQEWMKGRMQEKLQQLAQKQGEIFPPQPVPPAASASTKTAPAHRRGRTGS
jgi:hypothetical protein